MKLPLIITPDAEQDLAKAKAWYEEQREGLGEELLMCVEAAFEHIKRAPKAATEIVPGVWRVVVRRFPYCVFYRIDPDQIAILAVYDSRRDPRGWKERVSS
jgi:plasmid stabilization system protein ParE